MKKKYVIQDIKHADLSKSMFEQMLFSLKMSEKEFREYCNKRNIDTTMGFICLFENLKKRGLKKRNTIDISVSCCCLAEIYYRMPDASQSLKYYMQEMYINIMGYMSDLDRGYFNHPKYVFAIYPALGCVPEPFVRRIVKLIDYLRLSCDESRLLFKKAVLDLSVPAPNWSIDDSWNKLLNEMNKYEIKK